MTIEMVLLALCALVGGTLIGWALRHYRTCGCLTGEPGPGGRVGVRDVMRGDVDDSINLGGADTLGKSEGAASTAPGTAPRKDSVGSSASAASYAVGTGIAGQTVADGGGKVEMIAGGRTVTEATPAPASAPTGKASETGAPSMSGKVESVTTGTTVTERGGAMAASAPSAEETVLADAARSEQVSGIDYDAEIAASHAEIERLRAQLSNGGAEIPKAVWGHDPAESLANTRAEASALRNALWSGGWADDGSGPLAALDDPIDVPADLMGAEAAAQAIIDGTSGEAPMPPAALLDGPPDEDDDDLSYIGGFGPSAAATASGIGVRRFGQVAALSGNELAWLDGKLDAQGRSIGDRWLPQAQELAKRRARGAMPGRARIESPLDAPLLDAEREAATLLEGGASANAPTLAPATREDDLTRIAGLSPRQAAAAREAGIYSFGQIAAFSGSDLAWFDRATGAHGYAVKDRWVPQAIALDDLAALEATPLSDDEAAAARLLDDPGYEATDTNRPAAFLASPEGRAPDDLKQIKGIGPKIERQLNQNGVYYIEQIAEFGPQDVAWIDRRIAFRGRVVRDRWVPQAQGLRDAMANDTYDAPMSEGEAEAMRLIEAGGIGDDPSARPNELLSAPTAGVPDDLQRIKGVGPKLESLLHDLGIYYFRQIATLGPRELVWVDSKLRFKGRIIRDRWVPQATEFAREKGDL